MTCVGVPMGTPEFVNAFVRSKAKGIEQDVQKLRIVPGPKIHYDLLRFCQHTRLAFLARDIAPDALMRPVDVNFDPARGDRTSPVPVPVFIQDSIVKAILQRGLGATYDTLPANVLTWCRTVVELPHHEGGLGITPLPASGMAAYYTATANLVSWLGSLPHASEWVAGQTLDDSTTWSCSALTNLKQLHDKLPTHYNCTEWAPPPPAGPAAAPAPDAPAQGRDDDDSARPLSLHPLNLLASLRARQDEGKWKATRRGSRATMQRSMGTREAEAAGERSSANSLGPSSTRTVSAGPHQDHVLPGPRRRWSDGALEALLRTPCPLVLDDDDKWILFAERQMASP